MKKIFTIVLFLSFILHATSQNLGDSLQNKIECSSFLNDADVAFQNGLYTSCVDILEQGLQVCDLNKIQREQALELLSKAYIELDNTEQIDNSIIRLLTNNPHYELKPENYSEDFTRQVNTFRVKPKFSIGLRNSCNALVFNTTETYAILTDVDYSQPYNHRGISLLYYGTAEYEFAKNMSFNLECSYFGSSFTRTMSKEPSFLLTYSETDKYLALPFYLKNYFRPSKNTLIYLSYGMNYLHLQKALADVNVKYSANDYYLTGNNYAYDATSNNIDVRDLRTPNLFLLTQGIGFGYAIKDLRIFADLRYSEGLNSFVNADNWYANTSLVDDFYYVDNSVTFSYFEFGLSISYTLKNSVIKK